MSAYKKPTRDFLSIDIKENGDDPADSIYLQQVKKKLCMILDSMGELERKVLEMRFGLKKNREMTVDEVAIEMELTPERIRQLEAQGQRILRHPELSDKLKPHPG